MEEHGGVRPNGARDRKPVGGVPLVGFVVVVFLAQEVNVGMAEVEQPHGRSDLLYEYLVSFVSWIQAGCSHHRAIYSFISLSMFISPL